MTYEGPVGLSHLRERFRPLLLITVFWGACGHSKTRGKVLGKGSSKCVQWKDIRRTPVKPQMVGEKTRVNIIEMQCLCLLILLIRMSCVQKWKWVEKQVAGNAINNSVILIPPLLPTDGHNSYSINICRSRWFVERTSEFSIWIRNIGRTNWKSDNRPDWA